LGLGYAFEKPGDGDTPALNVFTRKDGKILHSWGDEMGATTADTGQDPRARRHRCLAAVEPSRPDAGGPRADWYSTLDDAAAAGRRLG
jgi:hypothetical protein